MTGKYPPVPLPDVPFARELQQYCLSLDGAWEDYPWGDVIFKVGAKMFAGLGGGMTPESGYGVASVSLKASIEDAAALTELPFIVPSKYLGRYGWVTVTVADEAALDLARDLITTSHGLVRAKAKGRAKQRT